MHLLEASDRLGGTLQFASIAYKPNQRLLDWLRLQLRNSSVRLHLNTTATPERLQALGVEEVVVATGARRDMPDIPGSQQDFVFSGDDMRAMVMGENAPALRRKTTALTRALVTAGVKTRVTRSASLLRQASRVWLPLGERVVIIGAELVGLELAEFLAERKRRVTVIDTTPDVGRGLYVVRRMRLLAELKSLDVSLVREAREIAIEDRKVAYTNPRGQRRAIDADHVIVAQGARGDDSLAIQLRAAGLDVHTVGDCEGVGYIEGAMESAAELAARL